MVENFNNVGSDITLGGETPQELKARMILSEIIQQKQPYSYCVGPALQKLDEVLPDIVPGQQEDSEDALRKILFNAFPAEWQPLFNFKCKQEFECICGEVIF